MCRLNIRAEDAITSRKAIKTAFVGAAIQHCFIHIHPSYQKQQVEIILIELNVKGKLDTTLNSFRI